MIKTKHKHEIYEEEEIYRPLLFDIADYIYSHGIMKGIKETGLGLFISTIKEERTTKMLKVREHHFVPVIEAKYYSVEDHSSDVEITKKIPRTLELGYLFAENPLSLKVLFFLNSAKIATFKDIVQEIKLNIEHIVVLIALLNYNLVRIENDTVTITTMGLKVVNKLLSEARKSITNE